ncbi:LOW QUALITY PROTEIN: trace amine-associated receptor 9 [Neomonachus schauinslandi]|uniref:LOW QUALITY PROTEIN: trace amine-associated receptor 9 n=1 Tax=Neomonachus schauinslandi TaxID=29088 RepID=A0A2Y9HIG3_NEOSC|nr:LOW QUALITY PROTEIN: trace amine-associated receptor 9 [Neomonachus schauinslandi]
MVSSLSPPAAVELCFENVNGSCVKTPYSPGPRMILYAVFGFGAVLTVFGNLLVVISILHFQQRHTPTNFLNASLACTDFLVGVAVMPFRAVRSVESGWYLGQSYCKFHTCFDTSFCFASLFHLCCISIDGYIAVTDPLTYPTKFTVSMSGICIVLSWFFSVTYSFCIFYTGANEEGIEDLVVALTCVGGCLAPLNQNWVLLCFLLFFIPTVAMVFIYGKIFLVARHQAREIESSASQARSSSESYWERVAKRERKAAKTLGIAMAAFLVSWLPYIIDAAIDAYMNFITPPYVYEILVWCVYYNSAMNPLIYAFFYPWFRKAIKLTLSGKVLRRDSSTINLFSEEADID